MKLFERTSIPSLGKALEAYSLRHKTIASNIANAGTVGYAPKVVRFEDQLAGADQGGGSLRGMTTDAHHLSLGVQSLPDVVPTIEDVPNAGTTMASGVNSVDIDSEMSELAKNQIRYKFASRLIGEAFRGLQKSIRGTV